MACRRMQHMSVMSRERRQYMRKAKDLRLLHPWYLLTVVISSAGGGLGHLAVQYASRAMGFRVIAINGSSKEALCKECGVEEFLNFMQHTNEELEATIKKIANNGRRANAVLVVSAANKSYEQGLKFLKP
ncbi:hypothetical protein VE01_04432 [Pseudogymnoascus verrucosus]|uniref:Alcohol dehydrogenase-like C-terminal domain-containing protein n=1 Tax=Pseudogymnoascus verrucosus TaxID=342668 RepID=A0A1B8GP76_9PEZI|nr:uncharacterized protein VE01_04432 [Pseudogymnoascus verrucosus]OBT97612.1 hypothetical protein VE01_04432 [Pseudogymnoascus verrucosus]